MATWCATAPWWKPAGNYASRCCGIRKTPGTPISTCAGRTCWRKAPDGWRRKPGNWPSWRGAKAPRDRIRRWSGAGVRLLSDTQPPLGEHGVLPVRCRQRLAVAVALPVLAAQRAQAEFVGLRLDAFRDHRQAQDLGDLDDGADHALAGEFAAHRGDEGPVDLDVIERQALQQAERRI